MANKCRHAKGKKKQNISWREKQDNRYRHVKHVRNKYKAARNEFMSHSYSELKLYWAKMAFGCGAAAMAINVAHACNSNAGIVDTMNFGAGGLLFMAGYVIVEGYEKIAADKTMLAKFDMINVEIQAHNQHVNISSPRTFKNRLMDFLIKQKTR